jgi:hypothetical protein
MQALMPVGGAMSAELDPKSLYLKLIWMRASVLVPGP